METRAADADAEWRELALDSGPSGLSHAERPRDRARPDTLMSPATATRFLPVICGRSGALFGAQVHRAQSHASAAQGSDRQPQAPATSLFAGSINAFNARAVPDHARLILPFDLTEAISAAAWLLAEARALLAAAGLKPERIILSLSHTSLPHSQEAVLKLVAQLRECGYLIAIEDQCLAGLRLRLLYDQLAELICIDPFLIQGLDQDPRKRLLLTQRIRAAQSLGAKVWASQIDSEALMRVCQDLGCDLLSGDALGTAAANPEQLAPSYPQVSDQRKMRRRDDAGPELVRAQLERLPTLPVDAPMQQVFDLFRQHVEYSYFPILAANGRPLGLLQERDIKRFIYSSYGRELLANRALKKSLADFLTPCPIVDIGASAEQILEVYAASDHPPGVLVTEDWKYYGFLSQGDLLHLIEQQNLASAREQNPLTGLPGNRQILEFITKTLEKVDCSRALVYFDFDHFKPFNDRYGFRHGDRMIQLFGDLLRKSLLTETAFVGHIGGDDFFAGFQGIDEAHLLQVVKGLLRDFAHSAESLYDPNDRKRGYIEAPARTSDETRKLPLIRCSAAMLLIPAGVENPNEIEVITRRMATLKKAAKASADGLATQRL